MYDPIKLSKKVEDEVTKTNAQILRLYYRFRPTKFYSGCSTGDVCGCNLRCKFCWSWKAIIQPKKIGKFYTSKEVVSKLIKIAEKYKFNKIRLSGGEPTISKEHLLEVIKNIPGQFLYLLETNGLLIGYDKSYAEELSKFSNLHVRVSLKGSSEEEFAKFTGAKPEAFELQFKALENLITAGVSCHAAVIDLVRDLDNLRKKLKEIDPKIWLEIEPLLAYSQVVARLEKAGIEH